MFDLCMVELRMLLVAHYCIECQTIGLSITGRAGEERYQTLIWNTILHLFTGLRETTRLQSRKLVHGLWPAEQ